MKKYIFVNILMMFLIFITGCNSDVNDTTTSNNNNTGRNGTVYVNGELLEDSLIESENLSKSITYQLYDNQTIDLYTSYSIYRNTIKIINSNQKTKDVSIDGMKLEYKPLVEIYNVISKNDKFSKSLEIRNLKTNDIISTEKFSTEMVYPGDCVLLAYINKGDSGKGGFVEIKGCNKTENMVSLKDIYPTEEGRISYSSVNGIDLYNINFAKENTQQQLVEYFGQPYAVKAYGPVIKGSSELNLYYYYKLTDNYLLRISYSAQNRKDSNEIFFENGRFGGAVLIPYTENIDQIIGIK